MASWNESKHDHDLVPTIDLHQFAAPSVDDLHRIAMNVDQTCRRSGFFIVTGHGVSPHLRNDLLELAAEFFLQDDDAKQHCVADGERSGMRGLFRRESYVAASSNQATPPDLCEVFIANRLGEPGIAANTDLGDAPGKWASPNRWPQHPIAFRSTVLGYYKAMENLSNVLLQLFALAHGLDRDWFTRLCDQHISNLCLNWYPPLTERPTRGQLRKGEHSDWGTLTILLQDGTGGLQIQRPEDGTWIDVPHVYDGLIINIGDLMARWTNDRWVSTKHRVLLPSGTLAAEHRLSAAYFHTPNWNTTVECLPTCVGERPRYGPITAGAYLSDKLRSTRQPLSV